MKIQLETGEKIEVPDGSTPEQIDDVIQHLTSSKTAPAGPRQYENSLSGDLARRADAVEAKKQQAKSGKISELEKVIGQTSEGFGIANDAIYRGIVEPAASIPIPFMGTTVGGALNQGLSTIANTPSPSGGTIGSDVSAVSGSLNRSYDMMKQQYPRTTEVTEDVANIALNLLPVAKTKVGRNVAETVTAVPREVVAAPVKIPVKVMQTTSDFVSGVKAYDAEKINKAVSKMYEHSDDLFRKMESSGEVISKPALNRVYGELEKVYTAKPSLVKNEVEKYIKGQIGKIQDPRSSFGIRQLEDVRQQLGTMADNATTTAQRQAIKEVQEVLRVNIEALSDADFTKGSSKAVEQWKEAIAASSQYKKMKQVGEVIKSSKTGTQTTTKLKKMADSPKKTAALSVKEKAKLKRASETSMVTEAIKDMLPGLRGGGSGGLKRQSETFLLSYLLGPSVGIPAAITGDLIRSGSDIAKKGRANKLFRYLETSNPLVGKK